MAPTVPQDYESLDDSIEIIDTEIVASNDSAEIDDNGAKSTNGAKVSTKVVDDGTKDKSGKTTGRCTKRTEGEKDQKKIESKQDVVCKLSKFVRILKYGEIAFLIFTLGLCLHTLFLLNEIKLLDQSLADFQKPSNLRDNVDINIDDLVGEHIENDLLSESKLLNKHRNDILDFLTYISARYNEEFRNDVMVENGKCVAMCKRFHQMYTLILGAELEKGNDEKVKDLKVLKPHLQKVLSKLLVAFAKYPIAMESFNKLNETLEHDVFYKYNIF
ncbi:unnamed protein product [Bursaphelenchus okinawaensis]|uniref:Uncharacterized protein n=1 Tax=Bursaphelenchus okinawaensis TaxID=465554 RepID=A0A811K9J5_9BILA|nr:unnamed protein product [Bursaphelenchus okinawaensis]CAG9097406.1 unnamed protein product [Bursaphelenchus okinawaensis]